MPPSPELRRLCARPLLQHGEWPQLGLAVLLPYPQTRTDRGSGGGLPVQVTTGDEGRLRERLWKVEQAYQHTASPVATYQRCNGEAYLLSPAP